MTTGITINRLFDAVQWELWHQRLAHPGTNILQATHKHTDGVPSKLHDNAFYCCLSCMTSKTTKLPGHYQTLGATQQSTSPPQSSVPSEPRPEESSEGTRPSAIPSPTIDDDEDHFEEYVDSLYLPEAWPGQHFHIDFSFLRGSEFQIKREDGEGPTITIVDEKKSYCLIIYCATRYMWVYLSNTKEPPVSSTKSK